MFDVGDHHRGPGLGQRLGVDDADAAGAAGDHGDLVGQVEQVCSSHGVDRTTSAVAKSSSLIIKLMLSLTRRDEEGKPWGRSIAPCPTCTCTSVTSGAARGGGGVHQHVYPATGEVQGPVPLAGADDVDEAVQAASAAFETWRTWTPWQRRDVLVRLAELLEAAKEELARLSVLDNGMTYGIAHFTATSVVDYARYYAGWADKVEGRVTSSPAHGRELAYTAPEPYGVVGIIITWNGPLVSVGMKVMPALAAGNTVVVKPSELTPYAMEHFMALVREAGIPPGVVNVLPGHGRSRRGARPPPAGAEDQLHRRSDGRPHDPRRLRRDAEAGGARAGRQVGEPRVPRRRPRCGGVHRHRLGAPDPRRPGLCPRPPGSSCTTASTTSSPRRSSPSPATSRSATRSTRRPAWARS